MRFPQDFWERRQLYDSCDTRPLPLYAKGAGTKTSLTGQAFHLEGMLSETEGPDTIFTEIQIH